VAPTRCGVPLKIADAVIASSLDVTVLSAIPNPTTRCAPGRNRRAPVVLRAMAMPGDRVSGSKHGWTASAASATAKVAHVEITSSASDLLLWMWNRLPDKRLSARGDEAD